MKGAVTGIILLVILIYSCLLYTSIELRGNKSQDEVAKAIGISKSALSMYENGSRVPRDEIKVRLANYYKKSVQHIFFNKNNTKCV